MSKRPLRGLFLFLSGLVLAACTESELRENAVNPTASSNGILGGVEVKAGTLEAQSVAMVFDILTGRECSSTVISKDMVLTAAHCVEDSAPEDLRVIFTLESYNYSDSQERKVISYRRHERHRDPTASERFDLAVVRFEGELPPETRIARLPQKDEGILPQARFTAIGYGRTDGRLNDFASDGDIGILRQVELEVRNLKLGGLEFIADQSSGKGVCTGDSGGPAMVWDDEGQPMVLGVASGVLYEEFVDRSPVDFDYCRGVSLYVSTAGYREWIVESMFQLRFQPPTQ